MICSSEGEMRGVGVPVEDRSTERGVIQFNEISRVKYPTEERVGTTQFGGLDWAGHWEVYKAVRSL